MSAQLPPLTGEQIVVAAAKMAQFLRPYEQQWPVGAPAGVTSEAFFAIIGHDCMTRAIDFARGTVILPPESAR